MISLICIVVCLGDAEAAEPVKTAEENNGLEQLDSSHSWLNQEVYGLRTLLKSCMDQNKKVIDKLNMAIAPGGFKSQSEFLGGLKTDLEMQDSMLKRIETALGGLFSRCPTEEECSSKKSNDHMEKYPSLAGQSSSSGSVMNDYVNDQIVKK